MVASMVNWFNSKVREDARAKAPCAVFVDSLAVVMIALFKTAHRDQRQLADGEGGRRDGLLFKGSRIEALDVRQRAIQWFADQGIVDTPTLGAVKESLRAGRLKSVDGGCTFDIKVGDVTYLDPAIKALTAKRYASITYQK